MSEWKSLRFGPTVDAMMSVLVNRCVCGAAAHQSNDRRCDLIGC